jgi:hypothetical protein
MKYLQLFIALFPLAVGVSAKETLSYLYIQGDKQTPFYVKLEDAMQPRYGKNYCIIPQLAGGPTKIEILFQQNVFPAQQFNVLIPVSGSRGFLLVKRDAGFALYDLQQNFYLPAGNDVSEDHLPASTPALAANLTEQPVQTIPERTPEEKPAPKQIVKKEKPPKTVKPKTKPPVVKAALSTKDPQFIPGMELGKSNGETDNAVKTTAQPKPTVAITNSDCPTGMSAVDFKPIFSGMAAQNGDEDRLSYVMGKLDKCYESWQARAMAQMLTEDAARFTLFKKIYPRISDQGSFPLLDDLLTSPTWKAEFARLVHH